MAAPAETMYHRWLGWHAPAMRRLALATVLALVVAGLLSTLVMWQVAILSGWDVGALSFIAAVMPMIVRADGPLTEHLALREDETRDTARLLLLGACTASLIAVAFALSQAKHETGSARTILVAIAALTVILSWVVVNSVFTLRYAHLYYVGGPGGIDYGGTEQDEQPDYKDFAYLAFTIGMTYQVADTTLRDRRIRRTVLGHSFLSYGFGVVIVATVVNVVAGLVG
jgi:uncharacterized membrane protein